MKRRIQDTIQKSGLTIYDSTVDQPECYVADRELETILDSALRGEVLDYPLRTRSKVVKTMICRALGYPVPKSFRKAQPRFPGQNFDTYVQKANNLQIWNEEISSTRRYVIVRIDEQSIVKKVKVVTGDTLAKLDKTGTLTQKYQARSQAPVVGSVLVKSMGTEDELEGLLELGRKRFPGFLSIDDLYERLVLLVGSTLPNVGNDQERNRGGGLHDLIGRTLGLAEFTDSGQFPDIPNQLLEVKLQTSPTIDLGLVCPDSEDAILAFPEFRHCDARYAVFYGTVVGSDVTLDAVVLSTGGAFFEHFQRFEGKVLNKKLQIPLPDSFFS